MKLQETPKTEMDISKDRTPILIDNYSDEILKEALESDQGSIHIFAGRKNGAVGNNEDNACIKEIHSHER